MSPHGKSCTIILGLLPPGHDRGIRLFEGVLELTDGAVYVRQNETGVRVLLPRHLVERIEPVTDGLREGYEIDLDTELCVRAYYHGRRKLKTLGWDVVLAQAEAAPAVE